MAGPFSKLLTSLGLANAREPAKPFVEQGVAGFSAYGGYVVAPETNAEVAGPNRWHTAQDILTNISIIAASVRYSLNLISRPTWRADPPSDKQEAKDLAEFVEEVINGVDTSWSRIIRRSSMYRYHGFGVHEWVAKKRDDGRVGIESIEVRPVHTIRKWDLDENGGILGVIQASPQTGREIYLPRQKLVYLVDDSLTDRPDGMGWFRHLAEPAQRLRQYLKLETMGFERDLAGIPVGRAPLQRINKLVEEGKLKPEEAAQMVKSLEDFVKIAVKEPSTGLLLDSEPFRAKTETGETISSTLQWGMELLTGEPTSSAALGDAVHRLMTDMAMIIGTEQMLVGSKGEGGSRALSEDKSRNLYLTANSALGDMTEAYDRDIVTTLWAMNGLPDELRPKLRTEDVSFKDANNIAKALADMAAAGAILHPNDPAINDLRDLMGVSHAEEIDEATADLMLGAQAGVRPEAADDGGGGSGGGGRPSRENPGGPGGKPPKGPKKGSGRAQKYDPDQPRDPAGSSTGGQWTSAGGSPRELLGQMADMKDKLGSDRMFNFERWLLDNGEDQDQLVKPPKEAMGAKKQCYQNAFQALLYGKVDDDEWAYTEGSVVLKDIPLPIDHAWLSNRAGEVMDVTIRDNKGARYFGVPFDKEYVYAQTMKQGHYGLFSDGIMYQPVTREPVGDKRAWPRVAKFSPDQPRDPAGTPTGGQWTSSAAVPWSRDVKSMLIGANDGKDVRQMRADALVNQQKLDGIGAQMEELGIAGYEPPPPGSEVKTEASALRKIRDEGYSGAHAITDYSRASFVIDHPAEAGAVINKLAEHGTVYDKGWGYLERSGYLDRKVYLQHANGGLSEIQITPRGVFQVKMGQGHRLYEIARLKSTPKEVASAALRKSRNLYAKVITHTDFARLKVRGVKG